MSFGTDCGLLLFGSYTTDEFNQLIQSAEQLHYDAVWVPDERFFRDPWASLAWAAAHSEHLRLGVMVTDPFVRHPALTAMAFATVDEFSGGRAVLGLGAGISGFREMGIERRRPQVALREGVQLVRALLRGERVDFAGESTTFRDGALNLPARPGAPIYIASNGPRTMAVAGEVADGLIVQALASEVMIANVREELAKGAERAGRDAGEVRLVARLDVCVDADGQAARDAMRPGTVRHLRTHAPHFRSQRLAGLDVPDDLAAAVNAIDYGHDAPGAAAVEALIPEEFVERLCVAGTVDETARQVARLIRAGIDEVTVCPVPSPDVTARDVMETFARSVMPRARDLAAQDAGVAT